MTLALAVAIAVPTLAFAGGAGAQTSTTSSTSSTSTSTSSTSTTSTSTTSTSTSTTSTSTTSTSTTVPPTTSTTSTTICPPQRCTAAPPSAVLSGSKGEVAGEQGSYCWSGPGRTAVCRDSIFIDPASTLTVTKGELLSLRFSGSETPQELKLYRHDGRSQNTPVFAGVESVLSPTNPSVVRADFPEGTSWLVVASKWSQGSSVTFFKVTVKSPAVNQPRPLALTG